VFETFQSDAREPFIARTRYWIVSPIDSPDGVSVIGDPVTVRVYVFQDPLFVLYCHSYPVIVPVAPLNEIVIFSPIYATPSLPVATHVVGAVGV
jgi:hypothetical protein